MLEFEWGTDLYAIYRDDESSARSGWPAGDGGETWSEYGCSVPITWAEMCERYFRTGMNDGLPFAVRLTRHPNDLHHAQQWPTEVWARGETPEYRPEEDQHDEMHLKWTAKMREEYDGPDLSDAQ